jgi:MFS superfamily sulfate permease-like transporter
MEKHSTFQDYAIVACGTLNMELNHLEDTGFLDARKILYTKPGRHEVPRELESQLIRQLGNAKQYARKIIVAYGGKFCYVNADNLYRRIDTIIQEQEEPGVKISRIRATHCIDMLVSAAEREKISEGRDIYWLTPGWMKYRHYVYQGWDKGLANENFPKHSGGAMMLDAIGYYENVMQENPEQILDFSDWMGIPLEAYEVTLDRLKSLLLEQIQEGK